MIYEPFDYVHHKNKILNKMATVIKLQTVGWLVGCV